MGDDNKSPDLVNQFNSFIKGASSVVHHARPPEGIRSFIWGILSRALELGASDVFLSSGEKPSYRLDGKTLFFQDDEILRSHILRQYLFKVMNEYHRTQLFENLEHDFSILVKNYRFRVNAFSKKEGVSITFRVIPTKIPTFEEINLPESIKKIAELSSGLALITGSVGSGKSTTLAAIIDLINKNKQKHIITLEDPIEFVHKSDQSLIEQREIGAHSKSFGNALRSALREAPDVILVGELRDLESIALAITAAETGTLVLATLHCHGATDAVNRLIDIFPANQQNQVRTQLAQSLQAVVWQSLIPHKSGHGRVGVFEILFRNYSVANLIRENKTYQLNSVIETGQNEGMISIKKMIDFLVKNNEIDKVTAYEHFSSFELEG
jgi:twitching motility protein PilT